MFLVKTPWILKKCFPSLIWDIPNQQKKVYLTFDDGPTPEITNWTLDVLKTFNAKATFFCLGQNIEAHPDTYQRILAEQHTVGNHGYQHLNGWRTSSKRYIENIEKAAKIIDSPLFRPPYGRIKRNQIKPLKRNYTIVMWDVLSADFDTSISPNECYKNVVRKTVPGSIIVFHDSLKAARNLKYALPKVLTHLSEEGFIFEAIQASQLSPSESVYAPIAVS